MKFYLDNSMNQIRALAIILGIAFAGAFSVHAQNLNKATDLKATPSADAKTVKNLPSGTALKLAKREGFWVEVDAGGAKGWLKLSDITMGSGATGGIGALDTGRTGKGNIVSTSAARGLSAKELVAAKPDAQEFESLKSLTVSSQEAEQFAQAGGLKTRTLGMLPAPSPASSNDSAKSPSSGGSKGKKSKVDDDDDD
jgi:hypothetical protein